MIIILALFLAYAGMTGLCLAMNRHYRQVMQRLPGRRLRLILRTAGWGGLFLSFTLCVHIWGWSIGPVAWFGLLSVGTLLHIFMLPYAPRLVMVSVIAGLIPALAGTVVVLTG